MTPIIQFLMVTGLYTIVGLVMALMNLIDDRGKEYSDLGKDESIRMTIVGFWAIFWPIILIWWIFNKLAQE